MLFGEHASADGLKIESSFTYNQRLFWNTVFYPGSAQEVTSDFTFFEEKQSADRQHGCLGVSISSAYDDELDTFDFSQSDPSALSGLRLAYRELYEQTAPGEENSKRIHLSDYYDYYPIHTSVELPDQSVYYDYFRFSSPGDDDPYTLQAKQLFDDFSAFFRIPMLESEYMDLNLFREENGGVHTWGMSSSSEFSDCFSIYTTSIITDTAFVFTFDNRTNQGNRIDTSLIPGGWGIYALPYTVGDADTFPLHTDRLANVYPLNENARFCDLLLSEDGSRLLLFTCENGQFVLTLLDAQSYEPLQVLPFADAGDPESGEDTARIYFADDFIALILSNRQLALLTQEESGLYTTQFVQPIAQDSPFSYYDFIYSSVMDWDGQRLAFCTLQDNYGDLFKNCDLLLAIFEETGMTFCASYRNSLAAGTMSSRHDLYSYLCFSPYDDSSLRITWE